MAEFDDDIPRPRPWGPTAPGQIPRAFAHRAGGTHDRTATELAKIGLDPLPAARPQRVPAPPVEAIPWIEVVVMADDGAPVEGVTLEIDDTFGNVFDVTTDAHGVARTNVVLEAPHDVRLSDAVDLRKTARLKPAVPPDGSALRIAPHDTTQYRIGTGKPQTIVLCRPRATIVSLDGWREGQEVLVFGAARQHSEHGPTTTRGILRTALAQPAGHMLVVGHADTKGGADDNDALAAERATSVALYLSGDRDAWADHAYEHANMTTLKAALAWAARAFGINCDPGKVCPGWNAITSDALAGLRRHLDLDPAAKYGVDDWATIYDLFDASLAQILYTDAAGLQARKDALRLSDDDCGERWPVDAPELDAHASPANRRVDLVLTGTLPKNVDEIYDGTFVRHHLVAAPEARVRIRSVTTTLAAVGQTVMTLQIGAITTQITADEMGLVEFTALRGETIAVLACTDLWAASRLVWGLFADMAPLGAGSEGGA